MENHKRILGIIFVVTAALEGLFLLFLNTIMATLFGFILDEIPQDELPMMQFVFEMLRYLPPFVLLVSTLPSLIAGFGLIYKQSWAMVLSLIIGILKLFSFPVGTCIGIYAIWIYAEEQKILKAAAQAPR